MERVSTAGLPRGDPVSRRASRLRKPRSVAGVGQEGGQEVVDEGLFLDLGGGDPVDHDALAVQDGIRPD